MDWHSMWEGAKAFPPVIVGTAAIVSAFVIYNLNKRNQRRVAAEAKHAKFSLWTDPNSGEIPAGSKDGERLRMYPVFIHTGAAAWDVRFRATGATRPLELVNGHMQHVLAGYGQVHFEYAIPLVAGRLPSPINPVEYILDFYDESGDRRSVKMRVRFHGDSPKNLRVERMR